jgi:hypothetical protein
MVSRPEHNLPHYIRSLRSTVVLGLTGFAIAIAAGCQSSTGSREIIPIDAPPSQHVQVDGRVLNADGQPVTGADIVVAPNLPRSGLDPAYIGLTARTGADGRFSTLVRRATPRSLPTPDTVTAVVRVGAITPTSATVLLQFAPLEAQPPVMSVDVVVRP